MRWALAASAVIALVGATFLARDWVAVQRADERADADLQATNDELAQAREDHAAKVAEVEALRITLEAELATLSLRQAEAATAQGSVDAAQTTLSDLEGQLSASSADLAASQGRLDTLQICLLGVAEGLNQVSVGDPRGLAVTLRDIESVCAAAGAQL